MTSRYERPVPLARGHAVDGFECRSAAQTDWLRNHAAAAHASGTARVFVTSTAEDPETMAAYYAWTMASVEVHDLPPRAVRGAGRYPQPMALLARLGVDVGHEGRGLGAALLGDVILRLVAMGDEIGCRGLLIHAETPEARTFYFHLVPEFEPSPSDPLHLVLLMKDARRTLGA